MFRERDSSFIGNSLGNPELRIPERELLRHAFNPEQDTMTRWDTGAQLLHCEPHPGNLLGTSRGPRFVDLHTCQRGPIEYDIAFVPDDVAALNAGANPHLVHEFRVLMWAGFSTMGRRAVGQFPERDVRRIEGLNRLRQRWIALQRDCDVPHCWPQLSPL